MTDESAQHESQQLPTQIHDAPSPPKRPTWATVIGIIAIAVASLGLLSYAVCTPASTIFSYYSAPGLDEAAQKQPGLGPTAAQLRVSVDLAPLTLTNACILAGLGIVLLIGGIGLLRMRRWSRAVLLWWATLRITAVIPASVIGWIVQRRTFEAMDEAAQAGGGPTSSMFAGFKSPLVVGLMVGIGVVFTLAMPVFTLIWFNRKAIRSEIRSWPG